MRAIYLQLKQNGEQQPLLIAGGGGGLGPTKFRDDGVQHAKGLTPHGRNPYNGLSFKKNAGQYMSLFLLADAGKKITARA